MGTSQTDISHYATLLRNVSELIALKPWLLFEPTDVFAVQIPDTAEIFFIQMTGEDSDNFPFELIAHRGPRGLELLWDLNNSEQAAFVADQTANVDAILCKLTSADELDSFDSSLLIDVEQSDERSCIYPVFRSFKPGFQAAHLQHDEVMILNCILRQAYDLAKLVAEGTVSLEVQEGEEDNYILRKPEISDEGIVWHTETINMNLDEKLPIKYPKLKRTEIATLKQLPGSTRELRLEVMVSPFVSNDINEMTPSTLLFTARDWNSGDILCARIEEPGAKLQKFRDSLLGTFQELLLRLGEKPAAIHLEAFTLLITLKDTAEKLGIAIEHHELPPLQPAESDAVLKHLSTRFSRTPAQIMLC